ncbi:hypothetical protein F5B19DRAFT_492640 [Rostrohypoxylon terebratum]|nr:hypothetical protein F5B19DRAFT_492640 [Rostrohypoxylon terebratum]
MKSITILVPLCLAVDAVTSLPLGAVFGIFMILFLQMIRNGVLADGHRAGRNIASLGINAALSVVIDTYTESTMAKEVYGVSLIGACRRFCGLELPALYVVATVKLLHAYLDDDSRGIWMTLFSFLAAIAISDSTFIAIRRKANTMVNQALLSLVPQAPAARGDAAEEVQMPIMVDAMTQTSQADHRPVDAGIQAGSGKVDEPSPVVSLEVVQNMIEAAIKKTISKEIKKVEERISEKIEAIEKMIAKETYKVETITEKVVKKMVKAENATEKAITNTIENTIERKMTNSIKNMERAMEEKFARLNNERTLHTPPMTPSLSETENGKTECIAEVVSPEHAAVEPKTPPILSLVDDVVVPQTESPVPVDQQATQLPPYNSAEINQIETGDQSSANLGRLSLEANTAGMEPNVTDLISLDTQTGTVPGSGSEPDPKTSNGLLLETAASEIDQMAMHPEYFNMYGSQMEIATTNPTSSQMNTFQQDPMAMGIAPPETDMPVMGQTMTDLTSSEMQPSQMNLTVPYDMSVSEIEPNGSYFQPAEMTAPETGPTGIYTHPVMDTPVPQNIRNLFQEVINDETLSYSHYAQQEGMDMGTPIEHAQYPQQEVANASNPIEHPLSEVIDAECLPQHPQLEVKNEEAFQYHQQEFTGIGTLTEGPQHPQHSQQEVVNVETFIEHPQEIADQQATQHHLQLSHQESVNNELPVQTSQRPPQVMDIGTDAGAPIKDPGQHGMDEKSILQHPQHSQQEAKEVEAPRQPEAEVTDAPVFATDQDRWNYEGAIAMMQYMNDHNLFPDQGDQGTSAGTGYAAEQGQSAEDVEMENSHRAELTTPGPSLQDNGQGLVGYSLPEHHHSNPQAGVPLGVEPGSLDQEAHQMQVEHNPPAQTATDMMIDPGPSVQQTEQTKRNTQSDFHANRSNDEMQAYEQKQQKKGKQRESKGLQRMLSCEEKRRVENEKLARDKQRRVEVDTRASQREFSSMEQILAREREREVARSRRYEPPRQAPPRFNADEAAPPPLKDLPKGYIVSTKSEKEKAAELKKALVRRAPTPPPSTTERSQSQMGFGGEQLAKDRAMLKKKKDRELFFVDSEGYHHKTQSEFLWGDPEETRVQQLMKVINRTHRRRTVLRNWARIIPLAVKWHKNEVQREVWAEWRGRIAYARWRRRHGLPPEEKGDTEMED